MLIEEKIAKYYLRGLLICIAVCMSTLFVCGVLSLFGIISSEAVYSISNLFVKGALYLSVGSGFLVLLLALYCLWNMFDE